jgi:hypothetical protein
MTGRERVRAARQFAPPDRAPRGLLGLPYVTLFRKHEFDESVSEFPMDIGASQISPGRNEKAVQATRLAVVVPDKKRIYGEVG